MTYAEGDRVEVWDRNARIPVGCRSSTSCSGMPRTNRYGGQLRPNEEGNQRHEQRDQCRQAHRPRGPGRAHRV